MGLLADGWTEASAIAGIAAACATVFLGLVTWSLVKATKAIVAEGSDETKATKRLGDATFEQAKVAARALALQIEPRIVPVHESPPRFAASEDIGGMVGAHWVNPLIVAVENAGGGVAEVTRVDVTVSGWGPPEVRFPGVVRSGSAAELRAEFTTPAPGQTAPPPAEIPAGADVFVRVHYRGGGREFQIAFAWTRPAGSAARWRVTLNEDIGHTEIPLEAGAATAPEAHQ